MLAPTELHHEVDDGQQEEMDAENDGEVIRSSSEQPKSILEYIRQLWDSIRMSVYVIGTALVVFVAARNSVTW